MSDEVMGTALASFTFIAVVWMLASAYKSRLGFKQRKLELEAQLAAASVARIDEASAGRHAELEQRLRVLERIATSADGSTRDIARQIEELRMPHAGPALLEEFAR